MTGIGEGVRAALRPAARLAGVALLCAAAAATAQEPGAARLDPRLEERLAAAPGERVSVLVALRPPAGPAALRVPAPEAVLPRAERHVRAVRALRTNAARAQAGVLRALREAERAGTAREVEPLWIANVVRADVTPELLREIAARPDVERVLLDRRVTLQEPAAASGPAGGLLAGEPISALVTVRVPEAWDLGFTGTAMLVANLDSGVQGDHPALAGKWRGLRVPVEQAWFDPFLNSTFPVDDDPAFGTGANGHGTATMGLMVAGERSIGVAFDAEWIAANIFENNQSFISTILKGLQWATDPDGDPATVVDVPDVINASFGLMEIDSTGSPTDTGICDVVFDEAVDAAGAAGAVVVFSAGNFDV
ncbi:MAG: S8 family serine peptidase, partial [Gemmatimonadota bacterium]